MYSWHPLAETLLFLSIANFLFGVTWNWTPPCWLLMVWLLCCSCSRSCKALPIRLQLARSCWVGYLYRTIWICLLIDGSLRSEGAVVHCKRHPVTTISGIVVRRTDWRLHRCQVVILCIWHCSIWHCIIISTRVRSAWWCGWWTLMMSDRRSKRNSTIHVTRISKSAWITGRFICILLTILCSKAACRRNILLFSK